MESSRRSRLIALVATVCAGLASCSDVVLPLPNGVVDIPDLMVTSQSVGDSGPEAGADVHAVCDGEERW